MDANASRGAGGFAKYTLAARSSTINTGIFAHTLHADSVNTSTADTDPTAFTKDADTIRASA